MELREKIINSIRQPALLQMLIPLFSANTRLSVVVAACIICSGTLTFQFVIVKSNIAFIYTKSEGPVERSKKMHLITRPNIYCILTTIHQTFHYSYEGPKRWSLTSPLSNEGNGAELVYVTRPRLVVEPDLSRCCLTLISCSTISSNAFH